MAYLVMTRWARCLLRTTRILAVLGLLSACTQNLPYRTELIEQPCYKTGTNCKQSFIEKHPAFDLTFLEFTERGNLYNRQNAHQVMKFINEQAEHENGVAVFVFVHGWKHTANSKDSNVIQFKEYLARASENEIVGRRKVIGVYLGWRGKSVSVPGIRETTYWGRKAVAEEIGSGGVTEVLSELQHILVNQYEELDAKRELPKNSYVIIGHSFGGSIVLSAIHDVLLHDIIQASGGLRSEGVQHCSKVKRFADGIVLLNPAIEANKIILLKEATARCRFNADQPTLMHIVSTDADLATRRYFPIGQFTNITRTLSPKKLSRKINQKEIELDEGSLNINTIGNLQQLRTAYLGFDKQSQQWRLDQCRNDLEKCGIISARQKQNHFPNHQNDPIEFIKTDAHFMKNHNDVFGCYSQSFITTSILETQAIDKGYTKADNYHAVESQDDNVNGCNPFSFNFKLCFNQQLDEYECELPN